MCSTDKLWECLVFSITVTMNLSLTLAPCGCVTQVYFISVARVTFSAQLNT